MSLKANLNQIKSRIRAAAQRANRNPQNIQLVIAGKYAGVKLTQQAIAAGVKIIGENRAQDLKQKYQTIGNQVDWHFIGHLQRNKVKIVAPIIKLLHSLDSLRLAEKLEQQLKKINKTLPVLIEVNTSQESSKFGVSEAETIDLVQKCSQLPHVKVVGLMTMGALVKKPEENRPNFVDLRQLAQTTSQKKIPHTSMEHLSMGTTIDFEVAIEEGATLVRLGSALFKN
jgi:pyridoxal phosphate enzyme (YggS family)